MSSSSSFSAAPILTYLSLPGDYAPSPSAAPVDFLTIHLRQLPPNLLVRFSTLLSARERTVLPIIRNRRQKYASTIPQELAWPEARKRWPAFWEGRERPGLEEGLEEKQWAERGLEFLGGQKGRVGKLGQLLGDYEEEREAERMREVRRCEWTREADDNDDDDDDEEEEEEEEEEEGDPVEEEQESADQIRIRFERVVREKFIYGLLDGVDYDSVDWDDRWDETEEQDSEERWFEAEEEGDAPMMEIGGGDELDN